MLASLESLQRELVVSGDRSRNRDCVDVGVVEQIVEVCGDFDGWIAAADCVQAILTHIANRDDLRVCYFKEIADQIWSPVSVTDDAEIDHASSQVLVEINCRDAALEIH